jgi:seryl-tRNA synthetase
MKLSQLTAITKQLLDIKKLEANLRSRNVVLNVQDLETKFRTWNTESYSINALKASRNKLSQMISKGSMEHLQRLKELKSEITLKESQNSKLEKEILTEITHIPNLTHESTPIGSQDKAQSILTCGSPRVSCGNVRLKDHLELGKMHNLLDMERGGKVSGNSFYFLKNDGALLELALTRYAIDICRKYGFNPIITPDVIRYDLVDSCGFKPRNTDPQTYFVSHSQKENVQMCLSATAEFPLAGMYSDETLEGLPLRMVGFGRAFRAEGLSGAHNRGLYRVHQFSKVEMFGITRPSESQDFFNEIVVIQKEIFQGLELCFRVLNMPSEELGASAYQKIDMEAWMPGKKAWGEISSASNCSDFQASRLNIRYLNQKSKSSPTDLVHTINGTAAAIPRLIIAILETHQTDNGDIRIPKKLRPYFKGENVKYIRKK